MRDPVILDSTPVERDGRVVYETQQPSGVGATPGLWRKLRRTALLAIGGAVALALTLVTLVLALPLLLLAALTGRPRGADVARMMVWRFRRSR